MDELEPTGEPLIVHRSLWRTSEAIDLAYIGIGSGTQGVASLSFGLTWTHPLRWVLTSVCTVVASVGLIIAAKRALGRADQPAEPGKPTHAIVTDGVFAHTRNPIYLASFPLYGAIAFGFDAPWFLLLAPLAFLAYTYWLILPEERALIAHFGETYRAYLRSTRRWL